MWPQYSPWMMKPAACGYWSTLGWPSHGVSSFRSVCGQGQSGGERAEGHGVLQKGETLFTRTFPLSVGRLNLGKFLLCPKLPDGLLIFHALINARLWRYMIRISVTAIDWRCSDVYLRAHGAGARVALCAGTFDASLRFHPSLWGTLATS